MPKKTYELKSNLNSAEMAYGAKLIRLEQGKSYETSDAEEQQALEAWDAVKTADKGNK